MPKNKPVQAIAAECSVCGRPAQYEGEGKAYCGECAAQAKRQGVAIRWVGDA